METFIENLQKYFDTTSRDRVLEDWSKTEEFDQVGPVMDDFLGHLNWQFKLKQDDPNTGSKFISKDVSPKFTSGFFC